MTPHQFATIVFNAAYDVENPCKVGSWDTHSDVEELADAPEDMHVVRYVVQDGERIVGKVHCVRADSYVISQVHEYRWVQEPTATDAIKLRLYAHTGPVDLSNVA